ncbi:MAG: DNA repair exonuclease [Aquificae bacterium]|nr:DNA repair exonuclease [Aquificota bacterium]
MEFVHVSDTHLGYSQYGLSERANDFFEAFKEAVDYAVDRKVDFVIHTGDFFHSSRPSNRVLIQGMELVKRLKEAGIPVFVISGNHDRGSQVRDVSPLSILQPVGLHLVDGGVVEYDGIYIAGLKYISKAGLRQIELDRLFVEFLEETGEGFRILMLHQEFQPFFPESNLNLHTLLPEGFDYVGVGHYHVPQPPAQIKGSTVVYAGSTEFTAYNEKEDRQGKGFYHVKVKDGKVEADFVPIKNRRPFINLSVEGDRGLDELVSRIKESVEALNSEKKPVLVVKGKVKELSFREILSVLEREGLTDRLLHVQLNLTRDAGLSGEGLVVELQEDRIREEISRLIGDKALSEKVLEVIDSLKSFDTVEEAKKFLKENPELLDF